MSRPSFIGIGFAALALLLAGTPAGAQTAQIAVGRAMWVMAPFPTLDVTADVGRMCNGKPDCQFVIAPESFGGRSPQGNGRHQIIVQYKCGEAGKNGMAYDAETLRLACP